MKSSKIIAGIVWSASLFIGLTAYAVTNDEVNYWKFDDAGGRTVIDSAGGKNGSLTGSSTGFGWASGKIGTALGMDGGAGESVVLPDGFLSGSQGSISMWFRINELGENNILFSGKSSSYNDVYAALTIDTDGRPQFQFRSDTGGTNRKAQGAKILNKNEWYHLVFTTDTQNYHMYVNGEALTISGDNIGRWIPEITNQTLQYHIGYSDVTQLTGSFNGTIDDMHIYNRPLTMSEVTALYDEGNAGVPTVPLAMRPTLSFAISSDTALPGGSVTLTWASEKTTSCVANGDWSGAVATKGEQMLSKLEAGSKTYSLSCAGKGGGVSASVNVVVSTSTSPLGGTASSLTVSAMPIVGRGNGVSDRVMAPPGLIVATWNRNLRQGVSGEDVNSLQLFLIKKGFLAPGSAVAYFGPKTKAALMKFQQANGIPATGLFGPMTRAKVVELNK